MNLLTKIELLRFFTIVPLAFSITHIGLNEIGYNECKYTGVPGICCSIVVLILSFWQYKYVQIVLDISGLFIGSFFQVTAKPDYWTNSAGSTECSLIVNPVGTVSWILGESLSFLGGVHAVVYAMKLESMKQRLLGFVLIFVIGFITTILVDWAVSYI